MTQRRIGILGYDGIQALDLVGPAETFSAVPATDREAEKPYEVVVIGLGGKRFESETGLTMHADVSVDTRLKFDTIIIPGGRSMRTEPVSAKTAAFIASRAPGVRRIASVCTGIYGLAPTGFLDGRRVTTHWRFTQNLQQRYPKLHVDSNALFIRSGKFYSSAGITAGIDLTLAMIEEDRGPRDALAAARELVVYFKRPGGQDQFSEPLQFQLDSADRFSDLIAWISGHLHHDISVEVMAEKVFLSPRQFTRAFKATYHKTPAAFVEEMRLSEASGRLSAQRAVVDAIARSVGYGSSDVFRRAFERRFGITPRDYRIRFSAEIHTPPR